MKVISGFLKGRIIKGYDILGTRPTLARVKESVFASIQEKIKDSIVLDLFSGSGNLGIEAISNYAKKVYFNDINPKCLKEINNMLIEYNVIEKGVVLNYDYIDALNYFKRNNIVFDLIFIDPPYKMDIYENILNFISENNLCQPNGIIIIELVRNDLKNKYNSLILNKTKKYGEKYVLFYKNNV